MADVRRSVQEQFRNRELKERDWEAPLNWSGAGPRSEEIGEEVRL